MQVACTIGVFASSCSFVFPSDGFKTWFKQGRDCGVTLRRVVPPLASENSQLNYACHVLRNPVKTVRVRQRVAKVQARNCLLL